MGNAPFAGFDQVFDGPVRALVIIDHYLGNGHFFTNAIKENNRRASALERPNVIEIPGFFRV